MYRFYQHPSSSVTLRPGPTATLADLSLANPKLPGGGLSWSQWATGSVISAKLLGPDKYEKNVELLQNIHHISSHLGFQFLEASYEGSDAPCKSRPARGNSLPKRFNLSVNRLVKWAKK